MYIYVCIYILPGCDRWVESYIVIRSDSLILHTLDSNIKDWIKFDRWWDIFWHLVVLIGCHFCNIFSI